MEGNGRQRDVMEDTDTEEQKMTDIKTALKQKDTQTIPSTMQNSVEKYSKKTKRHKGTESYYALCQRSYSQNIKNPKMTQQKNNIQTFQYMKYSQQPKRQDKA